MKYLAAEADARWEAKPKVMMDGPEQTQAVPALESRVNSSSSRAPPEAGRDGETISDAIASGEDQQQVSGERRANKAEKEDPWKKHRPSGPGEEWQPQAWTPPGRSR